MILPPTRVTINILDSSHYLHPMCLFLYSIPHFVVVAVVAAVVVVPAVAVA